METPEQWGQRQAALAPPWSDELWRRACATLGLQVKAGRKEEEMPGTSEGAKKGTAGRNQASKELRQAREKIAAEKAAADKAAADKAAVDKANAERLKDKRHGP